MATTFEQLSAAERARIEAMVRNQVASMSDADRKILSQTQQSLAYYVAEAIRATAAVLGYTIALPIAYAQMIVGSFAKGFQEGWDDAFGTVRRTWD